MEHKPYRKLPKTTMVTDPKHPGYGSFVIGGFEDLRPPLGVGYEKSPLNDDFAKMIAKIPHMQREKWVANDVERRTRELFPELERLSTNSAYFIDPK